jgi:hypothetical protein
MPACVRAVSHRSTVFSTFMALRRLACGESGGIRGLLNCSSSEPGKKARTG